MENLNSKILIAEKTLDNVRGIFDKNDIQNRLDGLSKSLLKENFWKDKKLVKQTVKKKKLYEDILNSYNNSVNDLQNLKDLYNLAQQEKNDEIINECNEKIKEIEINIKKIEKKCFLSGERDDCDIYLEIHAGAGGTESKTGLICLEEQYKVV